MIRPTRERSAHAPRLSCRYDMFNIYQEAQCLSTPLESAIHSASCYRCGSSSSTTTSATSSTQPITVIIFDVDSVDAALVMVYSALLTQQCNKHEEN
uniref:Uncharacterized protein n=1 Tax=Glossina pallidipes TaxID=7398 RepID=A0A1A9ZEZ5_GLOPL